MNFLADTNNAFVELNATIDNTSKAPLPDDGVYLLPEGCNTFELNDAVGNCAFPLPCTVVN